MSTTITCTFTSNSIQNLHMMQKLCVKKLPSEARVPKKDPFFGTVAMTFCRSTSTKQF